MRFKAYPYIVRLQDEMQNHPFQEGMCETFHCICAVGSKIISSRGTGVRHLS